jgi:hypothetical protein
MALAADVITELRAAVGRDHVIDSAYDLHIFARDASIEGAMPDAVVLPATKDEVAAVVKIALRHHIPVVPRGAGTGLSGGAVGGLLGSLLYLLLYGAFGTLFGDKVDLDKMWTPGAAGFVALGLCIGLLIGAAQVILKEAWVKVEAGSRPGRELIVSKGEIVIGRAESCDIGLFGDNSVERTHARILRRGDRYLLVDADTLGGTFLNGLRITEPTPLRSGDEIRVGKNRLRFGERRKQPA